MPLRFCSSDLWLRQAFEAGTFPAAIPESQFQVPGEGLTSHDGRRNLTDLQETAQWLGGSAVAKSILKGLLGRLVVSFHVFSFSLFVVCLISSVCFVFMM